VPYALFESCKRLIATHDGTIEREEFGVDITVRATFGAHRLRAFSDALAEATSGTVAPHPVNEEA